MKNRKLKSLISAAVSALIFASVLTGCAGRLFSPVYDPVPPGSTNAPVIVAYVPNTNAPAYVAGQTAQQVAPLLPPPVGTIVGGVGSLALAGLGFWARLKSKQALQAQDILTAVIAGVEAAGKAVPSQIPQVKAAINSHVAATGYATEFDKAVQTVSRDVAP